MSEERAPYTCPRCGAVSWHPEDKKHGWCGRCHAFTAPPEIVQAYYVRLHRIGATYEETIKRLVETKTDTPAEAAERLRQLEVVTGLQLPRVQ